MTDEIKALKIELWKTYQVIKGINKIAEERNLTDEEKEKLTYYIKQFRSIKHELEEAEEDAAS